MRIAITGSTGLVGSALSSFLTGSGHEVTPLVRARGASAGVLWDPAAGFPDPAPLEGLDGVVHLAGESIASGRWMKARKARIRNSRVTGTRSLSEALGRLARPPRALVCASAVGYYGDRGDEVLAEDSPPGDSFLARVCREWEEAAQPAAAAGIRVVNLRFGVILSPRGGALAKMLPPFRLGVGGVVGSGRQYMPWISLDDAVGAVHRALTDASLSGPVNAVAPEAVTNRGFTKALGRVLGRPTVFPMPAFVARLAFGEMADALLLASARVVPARLQAAGHGFRHPGIEGALRDLLGRD